jgi:hypothetical protein
MPGFARGGVQGLAGRCVEGQHGRLESVAVSWQQDVYLPHVEEGEIDPVATGGLNNHLD